MGGRRKIEGGDVVKSKIKSNIFKLYNIFIMNIKNKYYINLYILNIFHLLVIL